MNYKMKNIRKLGEYLSGNGTPYHTKLIDAMMVAKDKDLVKLSLIYPELTSLVMQYRNDHIFAQVFIETWNESQAEIKYLIKQ